MVQHLHWDDICLQSNPHLEIPLIGDLRACSGYDKLPQVASTRHKTGSPNPASCK